MNFDSILNLVWSVFLIIFPILISGIIGYYYGSAISFKDQKIKAYSELLPVILKMAYDPEQPDEKEFSKGLSLLWLFGNKKVTKKMEYALSILHHTERGDITKAFQEAIVEMRDDIQFSKFQKIKPEEVNHLYTKIVG